MPRRAPRWLLPLIAAAAGIASPLVSSCGATSPPAAPAHLTPITVGALPILDDLPVYLAQQEGYFAQQGLDVSIHGVP